MGYWLNYELHQKYGVMNEHQLMGIDLYHQFDGKRPAFFTSNFFRMLQNNVRFRNEECMVVGDDTHLQIVVWDAIITILITRFQSECNGKEKF